MTAPAGQDGQAGQAGHGGQAGRAEPQARVLLLTRPGCHLCDEARAVVARVSAELGVRFTERDVNDDPEDLRQYSEMVPVTFVDGIQHDFWRVSEDRLRAALLP